MAFKLRLRNYQTAGHRFEVPPGRLPAEDEPESLDPEDESEGGGPEDEDEDLENGSRSL